MKKHVVCLMLLLGTLLSSTGCSPSHNGAATGFLSDYSRLTKESESSMRFVDNSALAGYDAFIVDPVQVRLHSESRQDLTDQQISHLTSYMHGALVDAVKMAGKTVADQPGDRVARLRAALTDIRKSDAVSMLPQASLLGVGIGGASMEAEIVDSQSGRQIGAVVESARGSKMPFSNMGDWTAAKKVIDEWAQRLQYRLQ